MFCVVLILNEATSAVEGEGSVADGSCENTCVNSVDTYFRTTEARLSTCSKHALGYELNELGARRSGTISAFRRDKHVSPLKAGGISKTPPMSVVQKPNGLGRYFCCA